jgi:predicted ester cyclase
MYRVLDGKIAEHFANRDDIGMMRQLGLLPSAPSLSGQ